MELMYIWIEKYHNIKNQGFNFSNKHVCEFNGENNINIDFKPYEIPEDFFCLNSNVSSEEHGKIVNMIGIVGENGAGKSSILDFVMEKVNSLVLGEGKTFEKDERILAIVREENTLHVYVNSIIVNQMTIKDPNLTYIIHSSKKTNENNYKMIYYSNVFDAKKNYYKNSNIIDMSTNYLLNNNENYRISEIQRQLNLIASRIKIELPFKYPDFLNCSFSSFFYLSEIVKPESVNDFEEIVYQVFSNYLNEGTWESKNFRDASFRHDMYNPKKGIVVECFYKKYDIEERELAQKYQDLWRKVSGTILHSIERASEIQLENIKEYFIVINLPYNEREEFIFNEKIKDKIRSKMEKDFDLSKIHIFFWDNLVELIESNPNVRQAYFKNKNVKEKTKFDMLEYKPADKELQEFRRRALVELDGADPFEKLKIRICLCYFFVFYRTNHQQNLFRVNWKEDFMKNLLEIRTGTVSSIVNFFNTCEELKVSGGSRLGDFIECLTKLVNQNVVIIDENGKDFKLMIHGENINNYRNLILEAYNNSQLVFPQNYDFLDFDWYDMSSGEKAMFNLISRFYGAKELVGNTENLLILVDEGETYFHPEWQRMYIYILLEALPILFSMKKIQIIFTSNTPLVISDLPKGNVIFLENKEGSCCLRKNGDFRETFGANIHTLLSDSFFMKHDTIGKFAKGRINNIIDLLNKDDESFKVEVTMKKINLNNIKKEISIIGENLIRNKLLDMYTRKVKNLGFEEEEKDNKAESINLQQMSIDDLNRFKREIEIVLSKREFNDKIDN